MRGGVGGGCLRLGVGVSGADGLFGAGRRWWPSVLGLLAAVWVPTVSVADSPAAFEVDGWASGTRLDTMVEQARQRDLAIVPGVVPTDEPGGFDYERAVAGWGEHDSYAYRTRLLGQEAEVVLAFTAAGKLLYEVEVWWPLLHGAAAKALFRELKVVLDRRYDFRSVCVGEMLRGWASGLDQACWKPAGARIYAQRMDIGVRVLYGDVRLGEVSEREREEVERRRVEKAVSQDARRF